MTASTFRYNHVLITIHWLSLALIIAIALSGEFRHILVEKTELTMRSIMVVHIGAGKALLVLTLIRLAIRLFKPQTPPVCNSTQLQKACAHTVHILIYVLLITEMMLGWLIVNAKGLTVPMPFLGFDFPMLVQKSEYLVSTMIPLHNIIGITFYSLLGLHIGAALWHQFIVKDNIISRMSFKPSYKKTNTINNIA